MQTLLGQPVIATLLAPPDVVELGARIEVPVTRAIVSHWQAAVLVDATWTVVLEPPVAVGEYLLVWRTPDPEPPFYETFVPLTAAAALVAVSDPSAWTPTPEDVARVSAEYTRERIDANSPYAGGETGEFTETTEPTLEAVRGFIEVAVNEIVGRVGVTIPARCNGLAKTAAEWHAAASVEAKRSPGGVDEADSAFRWKQASYVASLNELIAQARIGALRLA